VAEQQGVRARTCRRKRGFGTGVAAADHDDIEAVEPVIHESGIVGPHRPRRRRNPHYIRLGTVPAVSQSALDVARHKRQPAWNRGWFCARRGRCGGRLSGDIRPPFFARIPVEIFISSARMGWSKRRRRLQGNGTGGIRRSPQVAGMESLPCSCRTVTSMVRRAPKVDAFICNKHCTIPGAEAFPCHVHARHRR
jgi:hypothetical protein